jgi:hypothetical protein
LLSGERKNHHIYRYDFNSRVQQPGESFDSWMKSLMSLIKLARFENDCCIKCRDSRLLQQVIFGVNNPETRKLLLDIGPELTLDQASRYHCHKTSLLKSKLEWL